MEAMEMLNILTDHLKWLQSDGRMAVNSLTFTQDKLAKRHKLNWEITRVKRKINLLQKQVIMVYEEPCFRCDYDVNVTCETI